MRKDMSKVLTTRPRYGGNTTGMRKTYEKKNTPREVRYFKGVKVDLSPKRESMKRKHKVDGDSKYFSDHIEPLRRYLRKQVGRPWDDVWSEICQEFRGTGLQAQHIKQHVKWEVGGVPHSQEPTGSYFEWHQPSYGVVYVDEEGILRLAPKRSYRYKKPEYPYYRESDSIEYHNINGNWYRMEFAYSPICLGYYVVSKKAVSKKEILRLDLDNRTETIKPKTHLD